ncbi:MAG: BspA family leucine-rich repeat surface protein [Clostridiales bacterium]|nr:BspA family leucine-rich repeat surface protein [Clostridiales bacterium]
MKKLVKIVVLWTLALALTFMVNNTSAFADNASWDDFSDGSTEGIELPVSGTDGDLSWSISADGILTISGTGDLEDIGYGCERAWYDYRGVITEAEVNVSNITDMSFLFYGCTKLTSVDFTGSDTSNVTNMECMFYACHSLSSLDLSMLDTSSVTSMDLMFNSCGSLTSLKLGGIDTSSVVDMEAMFQNCVSLPSLDLSGFDTSNVNTMRNMFYGCYALEDLDLSSFDTSNVTTMLNMFSGCSSVVNLDLSSFETSSVTTMQNMFYECNSLGSLDLSGFNTSNVETLYGMFYECSSLTSLDLSGFDTSSVTTANYMFYGCSSLSSLDLSSFDTASITSMESVFSGCSNLVSLDLSSFDTSGVTDMSAMFQYCSSLSDLDLSNFDTSKVTDMSSMFRYCSSLTGLDLSSLDTSCVTDMWAMFSDCTSLQNISLNGLITSNVTDVSDMFGHCSSLTSLDLGDLDLSNVTSAGSMFYDCSSMVTLVMPAYFPVSSNLPDVSGYEWKNESGTVCTSVTAGLSSKMTYTRYTKEKDSQTVTISAEDSSITVGEITYVDAYSTGYGEITFSSSDTSIATVNSTSGLVTGKGAGTVTITATAAATDTYKKATASCTITIGLAKPTISSVTQSNKTVTVKWSKISGAAGYYVYRSTSSGSGYSKVATITSGSTVSWKDTASKSNGKTYYYKVYAYSGSVKSSASSYKSIKYMKGTVSSLTNKSTGITVKWSKVSGATGYYVYRKASSASSYTKVKTITSASTVSYTDTAVKSKNGTTYTYYVQPYNSSSKGAYATKKTVRLTGTTLSSVKNSASKKMTVKWSKKSRVTGYQIQYSTSSSFSSGNKTVTVSGASSKSKVISSLTKNKTYYVRIRTYKTVSGTKYYSAWSSKKSVKISK